MLIGGIIRFSLIDYPGKTGCVVFTQGCNFRCHYCHNPELVELDASNHRLMQQPFFDFLKERQGKLDAVTITGGEPTLQQDLISFIQTIDGLGYSVKLDTNGTNPLLIEELLAKNLIRSIAMDIKAPFACYARITGIEMKKEIIDEIRESIRLIMGSSIDYEFRTTVIRELLKHADILEIGELIPGAARYVLQRFVPSKTYNPEFIHAHPASDEELLEMAAGLEKAGITKVVIR